MRFEISLRGMCYGPPGCVVVIHFVDEERDQYMSITVQFPKEFELLKSTLPWPELVDFVQDKARQEYDRLGPPTQQANEPLAARNSPHLTFEGDIAYESLRMLYDTVGGNHSTGFFPQQTAK
jgi:hypothetical protein